MISHNKFFVLFETCLIIAIIQNLLFWINLGATIYSGVLILLLIVGFTFSKIWLIYGYNKIKLVLFIVILSIVDQIFYIDGIFPAINKGCIYTLGLILYSMKNIYKKQLLHTVSYFFAFLLLISIFFYMVFLSVGFSPYALLVKPYGYEDYNNYLFFIMPCKYLIPRFSGPFIEPGHLAIFCCFILYANKFKFSTKKYLYVYLVAIFLSLSLAGYILLFIAFTLTIKLNFKMIIGLLTLLAVLGIIVTQVWNGGENPIYELIIKRLQYDDVKGIAGNNRTLYGANTYFKQFMDHGQYLLGIGARRYGLLQEQNILGGAGYKIFTIQYGFIGLFLVGLFYFLMAFFSNNRKESLKFFLLMAICFIQRSYPEWIVWLLPYTCFIKFPENKNNLKLIRM